MGVGEGWVTDMGAGYESGGYVVSDVTRQG